MQMNNSVTLLKEQKSVGSLSWNLHSCTFFILGPEMYLNSGPFPLPELCHRYTMTRLQSSQNWSCFADFQAWPWTSLTTWLLWRSLDWTLTLININGSSWLWVICAHLDSDITASSSLAVTLSSSCLPLQHSPLLLLPETSTEIGVHFLVYAIQFTKAY